MTIKKVFKSTLPFCTYIFSNGKPAMFSRGEYYTDNPTEISELENEITNNHPFIHIDKKKTEIDTENMDPIANLRASIEKEILAKYKLATDPDNNAGDYEVKKINPVSTTDIAVISATVKKP